MAKSKGNKSKSAKKAAVSSSIRAPVAKPTATALIAQAHVYLAQSNFEQAINVLELAVETESDNLEARELLGISEMEGGDMEKGRQHLLSLLPPHKTNPAPSTYLYLAQTSPTPQEALNMYESGVKLLEAKISGMEDGMQQDADAVIAANGQVEIETRQEVIKECVTAIVAMIEIWMSDLCFEPQASSECDILIARAIALDGNNIDALLTLSSIRMSQSQTVEAKAVILRVSELVLSILNRIEQAELEGEAALPAQITLSTSQGQGDVIGRDQLPSVMTRHLLTRLLLEHHLYVQALRVNDSVRQEDEMEVEGAYLEGWAWYCRGEALGGGEGAAELIQGDKLPSEDTVPTKEECWTEALSAFMECASLHQDQEHPDEGILSHVNELVPQLEAAGIVVDVAEEDEEDTEDVEMT